MELEGSVAEEGERDEVPGDAGDKRDDVDRWVDRDAADAVAVGIVGVSAS